MEDEKKNSDTPLESYKEGLDGNDEQGLFSERSAENEEGLKDKARIEKQEEDSAEKEEE